MFFGSKKKLQAQLATFDKAKTAALKLTADIEEYIGGATTTEAWKDEDSDRAKRLFFVYRRASLSMAHFHGLKDKQLLGGLVISVLEARGFSTEDAILFLQSLTPEGKIAQMVIERTVEDYLSGRLSTDLTGMSLAEDLSSQAILPQNVNADKLRLGML